MKAAEVEYDFNNGNLILTVSLDEELNVIEVN